MEAPSLKPDDDKQPRVLLAGLPVEELTKVRAELENEHYVVLTVDRVPEMMEQLEDLRVVLVIYCDAMFPDSLSVLREAKKFSAAQWIIYSADPDTGHKLRLQNAGANIVLDYPVKTQQILLRTKQALGASVQKDYYQKVSQLDEYRVPAVPGAEIVRPTTDYYQRRQWLKFAAVVPMETPSDEIRAMIKARLKNSLKELALPGRISLVALGSFSPFPADSLEEFHVVIQSDHTKLAEYPIRAVDFPEILKAYHLQRAVIFPDVAQAPEFRGIMTQLNTSNVRCVAAIPLFRGQIVFAILHLRFHQVMDENVKSFIEDITGYAEEITPWAMRLDFLARQHRIGIQ